MSYTTNTIQTMKNILMTVMVLFPVAVQAQGTVADYKRAWELYGKFNQTQVEHWAHDIRWGREDNTLSYYIDTPQGREWHTYDASTREDKIREAKSPASGGRQQQKHPFGRQKQRHWMEVDEERYTRPVESPDGRWDAYIEGDNVVIHPVGKPYSEKRILTQDGTKSLYYSSRIQWSPDSKKLLVYKRQPVEKRYVYYVESSPHDQLQPVLHKQEYAKPGDALPQRYPAIIDVATGKRLEMDRHLIENQYALEWMQWSSDSREVTMEYNRRGHQLYQMLAFSAEDGSVRTVVEEKANTFVNYNRLWRQFIHDGKHLLWLSERDNWNHLYIIDVMPDKKGKTTMRQITKGNYFVRRIVHVDDSLNQVVFAASGMNPEEDPYQVHYYRIDMDGKNLVCLTPEDGNHQAQFSADRQLLVDTYSRPDKAPVTVVRNAVDGTLLDTLQVADTHVLESRGWRPPERFVAPGRDGKTLMYGLIQRPTNFDSSKSYPIIEYIYAGPGDAYTPKDFKSYDWNLTALAELGFVVVQLDGMGTSYRGKQFEEVCYKNLKDAGFPDRQAWIRAAAAKYPYMDINRVGIYGCSAGGQESLTAVLLHGDFYKCAYSACGCHDNRMDKIWWNEQWMGWPLDSSYVECSNVENAYRLERPLMLVVGEMDDNVDPASTMQVANALIRAGKDFELVVIPGAKHTMGESFGEHKRYDFFVKHLLGVNPPAWSELK